MQKRLGFTLVETIMVLIIFSMIGALIYSVVPSLNKSESAQWEQFEKELRAEVDRFKANSSAGNRVTGQEINGQWHIVIDKPEHAVKIPDCQQVEGSIRIAANGWFEPNHIKLHQKGGGVVKIIFSMGWGEFRLKHT
ncbi:MAG: type II secretion system GspH family protein [Lactobacillaceae bacterium]|jgi:prepilin-type N-terminal cleavage/methylation domain-containing protein|nr:type II secretion system GspH family protein [Lactobacillaceae bacterium]